MKKIIGPADFQEIACQIITEPPPFSQLTEGSLDETLLSTVSKSTLDRLLKIRKTTIRQRKSLLSNAQETNSDGPYTTLNALKHLSVKAENSELQLFFRIFFVQFSTDSFCGQFILSAVVLWSFLTIRCKVRRSLFDNFGFWPDLCFAETFFFFFKGNHYFRDIASWNTKLSKSERFAINGNN